MATRGNRPLDEVTEEREQLAWELRQQLKSQASIAAQLGVSQQAVSKMLSRRAKSLFKEFASRQEQIKVEQTLQLEVIVEEAKAEWERSKLDIEKTSSKGKILQLGARNPVKLDGDEVDPECEDDLDEPELSEEDAKKSIPIGATEITSTTEGRLADPRYLQQAREAMADIRKIWGAQEPEKQVVENKHSGSVTINEPAQQKAAEELSEWRKLQIEKLEEARKNAEATLRQSQQENEISEPSS